jgi:hypothetical protein
MIKRFFPIPLLLILLLGCKKERRNCCVLFDTNMRIAVQSSSKLDLLDPQSSKFNDVNIEVFDRMESGYVRVNNGNMDRPKRFAIFHNLTIGKYELDLGLNTTMIAGFSETLIKFGENVPDTIRALIIKKGGSTTVSQVTVRSATFHPKELYTFIKD